jgi:hypothetical protein
VNRVRRLFHRHRWVSFTVTSKVARTTHTYAVTRCWCGAYGTSEGE